MSHEQRCKPTSWLVVVIAKPGNLLLGGVKRTQSSRFASLEDAQKWLSVALEANRKAGRIVEESYIEPMDKRAEIADSTAGGK